MATPLFKFGIKDKCQSLLLLEKQPVMNEGLVDLSFIPGSADTFSHLSRNSSTVVERIRKSSFLGFRASTINPILSLTSYINSCYISSNVHKMFSENPAVDEWIEANPQVAEAWNAMKNKAGAAGPQYSIGGSELEQAERALIPCIARCLDLQNTSETS